MDECDRSDSDDQEDDDVGDGDDENDDSDILTDEKPNVMSNSSPQRFEKIKSLSQSITDMTNRVLTKINSELNSAQEKQSIVIYQSQCNASIDSKSEKFNKEDDDNESIKLRRKKPPINNRRSFQEKRGLLVQTSQRKLKAMQGKEKNVTPVDMSQVNNNPKINTMHAFNTCSTPKFQNLNAQAPLHQQQDLFGYF